MIKERKYTFGPVPSRRLGLSLGVDVIPKKLCSLDCIYCEVGVTDKRGIARKEYFPADDILTEVKDMITEYPNLDHITISGSGEPTLNSKIGYIIRGIKLITNIPVAVLTNGTLFSDPQVRNDLLEADIVSPSLDAVTPEVFEKIDRPNPNLNIENIIDGIKKFRNEYHGIMWLEILFAEGINDSDEEVHKIKRVIDEIRPDKIHLNTVVRPPAYSTARPVSEERMKEISKIFGDRSEIIGTYKSTHKVCGHGVNDQAVFSLLARRAMTLAEMADSLEIDRKEILKSLDLLMHKNKIKKYIFNGLEYYQVL